MTPMIRILAGFLSCLAVTLAVPAQAERRYTVDDMLALESIGKARFDPAGDTLIFERYGPFEEQSDFGRQYVIGELRSRIYWVDLATFDAPRPLFDQRDGDGYTVGGISPDGAYMAYLHTSEAGLNVGVSSLDGSGNLRLDLAPEYLPHVDQAWIGGHLLPLETLGAGEVTFRAGLGREQVDALVDRWRLRNAGTAPTASLIGSGRFRSLPESESRLVLADARDGSVRAVADGEFAGFFAASEGAALAALRKQQLAIDPTQRLEHGANMGGVQHQLLVFDPADDGRTAPVDACPGCDVLSNSLNWSASAPLLSFYARDAGAEWADAQYRIYDHRSGETRVIALDGIAAHVGRAGVSMDVGAAWLGERLAVFASATDGEESDGTSRADWYLLGESSPRNLTAEFPGESPTLIGLGDESLVLLHDGDAWMVDAAGARRNLTASVAEAVKEWRQPSPFGGLPHYNMQPTDTVILEVVAEDDGGPGRLLFVELATGRIDTVTAASRESKFIAASPAARRVAFIDKSGNQTLLMIAGADGSQRELARLNEHLKGVVGGTPVRIDHEGPDGDGRISWMLLPPGHAPGEPLATVVNVYPGASCRETYSKWQLDQTHALNDHILAARGYAVLYPCIPVAYHEVPRDPLDGLVDAVFSAVDAAAAEGHVDPDRLAVQGQSYGGYTTGALIGLTDRFKSAVAQAGLYNLTSGYGQFDQRRRLVHEKTGLDLFAVSLMETSQGGMGAPPWDDPDRYLRNSPLMHVKNVTTPVLLLTGDLDYVSTTQTEEFFTALTRLDKDAVMVRYFGEDHVYNSPANIRDMWERIFDWYEETLGPPLSR